MKVLRLVAGVQNVKQLLDTCLNSRQEKLDVLVGLVIRLAKREDTEGGHKLLQGVRLWTPRCVDRLAPKRLLLNVRMLRYSQFWPMRSNSRQGFGQLPIGRPTLSG